MAGDDTEQALARIEAALGRMEDASARLDAAQAMLAGRHERLRLDVTDVLRDLDALLAEHDA